MPLNYLQCIVDAFGIWLQKSLLNFVVEVCGYSRLFGG